MPITTGDQHKLRAMSRRAGALAGVSTLLLFFALAMPGCADESASNLGHATAARSSGASTASVVPTEPGEVKLTSASAALDEQGIVRFQIHYQFTQGGPSKYYLCRIKFVGTDQYGIKSIRPGELEPQGTITTGIPVGDAPVKRFEITLKEADSPRLGFELISNTLTGKVQPADDSR